MSNRLAVDVQTVRDAGHAAVELAADYYQGLNERPIAPAVTADAVASLFDPALPRDGRPLSELLDAFAQQILPNVRHNGHPRFFGYVASPGSTVGAVGEYLAATLNVNLTSWRSGPAAAAIEKVVIGWFKQIAGFPPGALGLLTSGGSMANFCGLAAARSQVAPEITRDGITNQRLRIYASSDVHFSIDKAAAMLGIGENNVCHIHTDEALRMDPKALELQIDEDLRAGYMPMCIVASAGTASSGAVDPIADIVVIARRRGI